MKRFPLVAAAIASASIIGSSAVFAKPPVDWDGLILVKSKRLDLVYLQPGADFRGYTKVLVEPTEVAFAKNWQRDQNRASRSTASRVSDDDVENAITEGVKAANGIFIAAWTKGGFEVVAAPGPDVLRVKTGIVNIRISAPDRPTAGRSYSFSDDAGSATLFVEARDSMTGALIGRAVDHAIAGDKSGAWRTASSNRADFRELVEKWAAVSVAGVNELKSLPLTPP